MDNINYNPTDSGKEPNDPSGKVFKNLQESRGPAALLRQISSQVDNSSNLSKARKWAGITVGCLALVLVIGRWSHQETAIQNHTDRYLYYKSILKWSCFGLFYIYITSRPEYVLVDLSLTEEGMCVIGIQKTIID